MCGADPADSANVDADWGSPPRVRSRRNNLLQGSNPRGITSACAEQTSRAARCSSAWRDHLRVCGADWCEPCHRRPLSESPPRVRSRRTVRCGSTCRGRMSPPRVRSRPDLGASPSAWQGIISACAEQTGNPTTGGSPEGDHLRVCGADLISAEAEVDGIGHLRVCGADIASLDERARRRGSSPRVRSRPRAAGTPTRRSGIDLRVCGADTSCYNAAEVDLGVISACAEQTSGIEPSPSWTPDDLRVCGADSSMGFRSLRCVGHLRVCGADRSVTSPTSRRGGSSPRVRSRHCRSIPIPRRRRIISACAEQTQPPVMATSPHRDHLRVCGADCEASRAAKTANGSSPRVRSRLSNKDIGAFAYGIISACAEQTSTGRPLYPTAEDHLRVCGADWSRAIARLASMGSSPRVRSRLVACDCPVGVDGIISACAEQTR